jgi:preprotein translocase subunit SecD
MSLVVLFAVFSVIGSNDRPIEVGMYDFRGFAHVIRLGLDLRGGVAAVFRVENDGEENLEARVDGTVSRLEELLFSRGYPEAIVSKQGTSPNFQIRVEVPDVEDPETLFVLIGRPAVLEFRFQGEALVTGEDVENSWVSIDPQTGQFVVALSFTSEGARRFEHATTVALNQRLEIWVDSEMISDPTVNSVIAGGNAVITGGGRGGFTYQDAYDLASRIQSGALDVRLTLLENRTISATLGMTALRDSIIAGIIGIFLVFLFMIAMYKMLGVAASLALMVYTVMLIVFLGVFPFVQLTLPGIAGLILGIGMATDANVIIFERVKEEYKIGKPLGTSVDTGFKRAFSAILDSNLTTILGAVVLYIFAPPSIRSYAITLIISVVISFFSALTVTRLFINIFMTLIKGKDEARIYGLKRAEVAENE